MWVLITNPRRPTTGRWHCESGVHRGYVSPDLLWCYTWDSINNRLPKPWFLKTICCECYDRGYK